MSQFVSATLFDLDGTTAIQPLATATGLQWLDPLDEVGSFGFSIPVEDATPGVGQIVKIAYGTTSTAWVFAGVIETVNANQAGASNDGVARVYQVSGRGVRALLEDALVYNSGAAASRSFTAVSAGAIIKTLIDEAQARGALGALTYDFTASLDSNGDAYAETLTMDEQVGATLLSVAERHQELAVDYWVDPDLVLHYVNSRGEDLTGSITLRVGQSVGELAQQQSGPVRNTVLIATGDGTTFTTQNDAGSQSTYGRRETFLSLTGNADAGLITLAGTHVLSSLADPADGTTVQLDPLGPQPYVDFQVGDSITLARLDGSKTTYRVRSISGSIDDAGRITFVPELGTTRPDLTKRLSVALHRLEKQGAAESDTATDVGGGGAGAPGEPFEFTEGEVVSWEYPNGPGVVDIGGTEYDFANYTNLYPAPGDTVLMIPLDPPGPNGEEYGMVARSSQAGYDVAPTFPSGSLGGGYPFDTDQAAYPMSYHGNMSDSTTNNPHLTYDRSNQLGFGLEAVIGHSGLATTGSNYVINGVVLSTGANLSIGTPPAPFTTSIVSAFGHQSGYVYVANTISSLFYTAHWSPGAGWSTPSSTTHPAGDLVHDPDTQTTWALAREVTTNYRRVFGFSGATRTDYGRMGLPNATVSLLAANSGWLCVYTGSASSASIYTKPSNTTANFTLRATGVNLTNFQARTRMSTDGNNLYAMSQPTAPAQGDLLDLDLTSGGITVYSDVIPAGAYAHALIPGEDGGWVIICGEAVINFPDWTGSPTSTQACVSVYGFTGTSTQEIYHNVDIKNSGSALVQSNAQNMKLSSLTRLDGDVVFWVGTDDGGSTTNDSFVIRLTNV